MLVARGACILPACSENTPCMYVPYMLISLMPGYMKAQERSCVVLATLE